MRVPSAIRIGSMTLLSLAAASAGCFSDRGIAIEVDVDNIGVKEVQTVAFYVGETPCDQANPDGACTTIAPPPGSPPPHVWFRDSLVPYTARVNDGTATFQLQADTPSVLPIIIVVGFVPVDRDTQDPRAVATLRKIEIPVDSARVVKTTLTRASRIGDLQDPSDVRVQVFPRSDPRSPCVLVERLDPLETDIVVPKDDRDCDGMPGPE